MSKLRHKATSRRFRGIVPLLVLLAFAMAITACSTTGGDDLTPPPATIIRSEESTSIPTLEATEEAEVEATTPAEESPTEELTPPEIPTSAPAEERDYPLPTMPPTTTPEPYPTAE
ncbi:MAG: hypothetical protein GX552_02910 [Chloroflexi bacterium]|jgi:hypothetical protein|nr:hypothetical protein [Chloroflexota bacterium]